MGESHKSRGIVTKLTNEETWKLGQWLHEAELTTDTTKEELARIASDMCARTVTVNNIEGVLRMVGRSIPRLRQPIAQDDAIKLLAQCITIIANQLGIVMPSKLEDLL